MLRQEPAFVPRRTRASHVRSGDFLLPRVFFALRELSVGVIFTSSSSGTGGESSQSSCLRYVGQSLALFDSNGVAGGFPHIHTRFPPPRRRIRFCKIANMAPCSDNRLHAGLYLPERALNGPAECIASPNVCDNVIDRAELRWTARDTRSDRRLAQETSTKMVSASGNLLGQHPSGWPS